jgi:hypothetical protein
MRTKGICQEIPECRAAAIQHIDWDRLPPRNRQCKVGVIGVRMGHLNSEIATTWPWYKELLGVCDRCELSRFLLRGH